MIMKKTFLLIALVISPTLVFGADVNIRQLKQSISDASSISEAYTKLTDAKNKLDTSTKYTSISDTAKNNAKKLLETAEKNATQDADPSDTRSAKEKQAALEEKQNAYDEAKANEQSTANKTLTALTTAATGIGTMELLQGRAEQKADKEADQDMAAYIATMKCTYADGKQVKAGPAEVELPGAGNQQLINYRAEYVSLANDLKERKNVLGMKAGIESEEILDKFASGLYDDENVGIKSGAFESRYRAQMLGSEEDQQKLDDAKATSKKRVMGGAIAAGAGVLVGVVGNAIINSEQRKQIEENEEVGKETKALLENEASALKDLRTCMQTAGLKDAKELEFTDFYPSVLSVKNKDCKNVTIQNLGADKKAQECFEDSINSDDIYTALKACFKTDFINKILGISSSNTDEDTIKTKIKTSIESVQEKFKTAEEKDKTEAKKYGISIGSSGFDLGGGMTSATQIFSGFDTSQGGSVLSNFLN